MKIITSSAALFAAAALNPDRAFRTLLSKLLVAISCDGEFDPGELVRLVIVEPGDTLAAVNADLSYTLTSAWDACDREGGWSALTYVISDWGEGLLLFIPDRPDTDLTLRQLCRANSDGPTN